MKTLWKEQTNDLRRLAAEPVLLVLIAALFAALFLFILYPLFMTFRASLIVDGRFTLAEYRDLFVRSYNYRPLAHSLTLGLLVSVFGTAIGYVMAWAVARTRLPLAGVLRAVAALPMISPPFLVALSAILLFGKKGLIVEGVLARAFGIDLYAMGFNIFGLWGLTLVETLAYFPTAFLLLLGTLSSIDPSLEEAALDMGASRRKTFWSVTFPLSLPGVAASALLLFIESLADFGNPLILSGRYNVLCVQSYLQIVGVDDLPGGAALAALLLAPSLIAFSLQRRLLKNKSFISVTGKPAGGRFREIGSGAQAAVNAVCFALAAFILMFYGTIAFGSLTKTWGADHTLTFANYVEAFDPVNFGYVRSSLLLAAIATPLTGFFGVLIAYLTARKRFPGRGAMELIAMLTFALPGTLVGIGYATAFSQGPIVLQGTAFIIIAVFVFRNAPVGLRAGIAGLRQIDPNIEDASLDLGAGSLRTFFKITLPLLSDALFAGLATSFVKAMTAISAVVFVVSGDWNLITVAILGYVENSDLSQAAAMSVTLIAFTLAALWIIQFLVGLLNRRKSVTAPWTGASQR